MNFFRKILRSNQGMSLIEVLMLAGFVGITTLAISQIAVQSTKTNKSYESISDWNTLQNILTGLATSPSTCPVLFSSLTPNFANFNKSAKIALYSAPNVVWIKEQQRYASSDILIDTIDLKSAANIAGTSQYTATLSITAHRIVAQPSPLPGGAPASPTPLYFQTPINMTFNFTGNTLSSCAGVPTNVNTPTVLPTNCKLDQYPIADGSGKFQCSTRAPYCPAQQQVMGTKSDGSPVCCSLGSGNVTGFYLAISNPTTGTYLCCQVSKIPVAIAGSNPVAYECKDPVCSNSADTLLYNDKKSVLCCHGVQTIEPPSPPGPRNNDPNIGAAWCDPGYNMISAWGNCQVGDKGNAGSNHLYSVQPTTYDYIHAGGFDNLYSYNSKYSEGITAPPTLTSTPFASVGVICPNSDPDNLAISGGLCCQQQTVPGTTP